jgi:hypothetical protein
MAEIAPIGPLQSPISTADSPMGGPAAPAQGQDPVLSQLLAQAQAQPVLPKPTKRRIKRRKPTPGDIQAVANRDEQRHMLRTERQSRDVALYRQHIGSWPKSFNVTTDQEVRSAQLSTLVNKLANMFSKLDQTIILPYDKMDEEKAAQRVENALYQLRKLGKRQYARKTPGESLQRAEFFYMLLHGACVKRILPDTDNPQFPWQDSLIDPATFFPTYGDDGLIRAIVKYKTTIGDIVTRYARQDPAMEKRLLSKLGYERPDMAQHFWNLDGDCIEYWDDQWYYVSFRGEDIIPVMEHGLSRIPFVTAMPVGEPTGMATPGGHYTVYSGQYAAYLPQQMGPEADLAEKGVSVFHYLVNTHRLKEMLETILFTQVEAASDPATIEYTAPHLMNQEYPALRTKRGASNKRQLGMHQVDAVPTSPRPTDFSPLFSTVQQEFMEGSLSPAMFGAEQGSNVTGTGMDTLIQQAKDMAAPYIGAWEALMAAEYEMRLEQYVDQIGDTITISAPAMDIYGKSTGELYDITPKDIQVVGTFVEVEAGGMTDQNEASKVATMNQAVQAGFYSQRYAMSKLQVKDPDQMFAEITSEKGMQHPMVMENLIIPQGFISQGQDDLAQIWMELVVAPKLMQMQMAGPGGAPGGMMGEAGAAPPGAEGGVGSQAVPVAPGQPPDQGPGGPPPPGMI